MEKWISRSHWQRQISPRLTFCLLTVNTLDDVIYMTYLLFDLRHFTTQPPTWIAVTPLNEAHCWSSPDSPFSSWSLCSPPKNALDANCSPLEKGFRKQKSKPIAVKSSITFPHQRNKSWTSNMPSKKEGVRLDGTSPSLFWGREKLSLEETTPVPPSQQLLRWAVLLLGKLIHVQEVLVKKGRKTQVKVSPGEGKQLRLFKMCPMSTHPPLPSPRAWHDVPPSQQHSQGHPW